MSIPLEALRCCNFSTRGLARRIGIIFFERAMFAFSREALRGGSRETYNKCKLHDSAPLRSKNSGSMRYSPNSNLSTCDVDRLDRAKNKTGVLAGKRLANHEFLE